MLALYSVAVSDGSFVTTPPTFFHMQTRCQDKTTRNVEKLLSAECCMNAQ